MALKNYYDLLEIEPTASAEEVKRAFRQQIARYHPDKVQHLGREFQQMAADRAAELTEAYRVLSEAGRRAEYDQAREAAASAPTEAPPRTAPPPVEAERTAQAPRRPPPADAEGAAPSGSSRFSQERASRDEFVRKATLSRFRQALEAVSAGGFEESTVRGFDIGCVPKPKLFGRVKNPRLLGCFVPHVDAEAIADAWAQAEKWNVPVKEEICVFLMGSGMSPRRELEDAIGAQRRRAARGAKVTLIPIDSRDWSAHMPTDAPQVARDLLERLRRGH